MFTSNVVGYCRGAAMLEKIKTYWFLTSTAIIAIILYMYQRKSQQLASTLHKLRIQKISEKLRSAKEDLKNDKANHEANMRRYRELKSRYLPILESEGRGLSRVSGEGEGTGRDT